jgi:hypothetical protein
MGKRSLSCMLVGLAALALALVPAPALADSHARIVRLSYVEGDVQIDRNLGQGYEKAIQNMPLTEGMKVATKNGRLEIEFEDGSAVRVTPNSEMEFTELALRDSGARVSTLTLKQGKAYFAYEEKQKEDEFTVAFGRERVKPDHSAHFRVDVEDTDAELAVFKGDVQAEGPSGNVEVTKNRTATFDLVAGDKYEISKNVEEDPFDGWDRRLDKYQQQYASAGSNYSYPYSYGVSDLNYYGSYYNVPGYGTMWQPYFIGAGWNPFMDGAWMFYPGYGYTWISAYPWGWMPYRYGNWAFVTGYGWMWQPGGWNGGWYTVPPVVNPPSRFVTPQPPSRGTATVAIGRGPMSNTLIMPRHMLVQAGSAGWGVPRGFANNLGRVSHEVTQRGFATVHTDSSAGMGPSYGPSSATATPGSGHSGGFSGTSHGSMGGHPGGTPPHR